MWKFQMIWAWIVSVIELSLFLSGLCLNNFAWIPLILAIGWTIWAIYATKKYIKEKIQKEKIEVLDKDHIDEEILNKIDIDIIERFLRKKKLKNLKK